MNDTQLLSELDEAEVFEIILCDGRSIAVNGAPLRSVLKQWIDNENERKGVAAHERNMQQ